MLSGYVKLIDFATLDNNTHETRIFLQVTNFDKKNQQLIPVKFSNNLAALAYYEINRNDYLYIVGELFYYKENNINKVYVLGSYYEFKDNPFKTENKQTTLAKFKADYSPDKMNKLIELATKKKQEKASSSDYLAKANKKREDLFK